MITIGLVVGAAWAAYAGMRLLRQRSASRSSTAAGVALLALGFGGLATVFAVSGYVLFADPCSAGERAALAEFPQYGGRRPPVVGVRDLGSCATSLQVPDGVAPVRAYYVRQLEARGWAVEPQGTSESGDGDLVAARRGGYRYSVGYEPLAIYTPGVSQEYRDGLHLAVHVRED